VLLSSGSGSIAHVLFWAREVSSDCQAAIQCWRSGELSASVNVSGYRSWLERSANCAWESAALPGFPTLCGLRDCLSLCVPPWAICTRPPGWDSLANLGRTVIQFALHGHAVAMSREFDEIKDTWTTLSKDYVIIQLAVVGPDKCIAFVEKNKLIQMTCIPLYPKISSSGPGTWYDSTLAPCPILDIVGFKANLDLPSMWNPSHIPEKPMLFILRLWDLTAINSGMQLAPHLQLRSYTWLESILKRKQLRFSDLRTRRPSWFKLFTTFLLRYIKHFLPYPNEIYL